MVFLADVVLEVLDYTIQNLNSLIKVMFIVAVIDELCDYMLLSLIYRFHALLFSNNTMRL